MSSSEKLWLRHLPQSFFTLKAWAVSLNKQFISLSLIGKILTILAGLVMVSVCAVSSLCIYSVAIGYDMADLPLGIVVTIYILAGLALVVIIMVSAIFIDVITFSKNKQQTIFDGIIGQRQALIDKNRLKSSLPKAKFSSTKSRL